jgi:response regulator RpfG family c-di-GMP phosphodiesterase
MMNKKLQFCQWYPRHLKGEKILMGARILAVAGVMELVAKYFIM